MSSPRAPVEVDWSPFEEDELDELGEDENWPEVFRILRPVTNSQFAVTDAVSQTVVDAVRAKLDSAALLDGDESGVIYTALSCEADGDAEVIKEFLACGVNPDVPDPKGWRPSHLCGSLARFEAAQAIFLCRPDMKAKNANDDTPLEAAAKACYDNDDKFPARAAMRPFVHEFVKNGQFESRFPGIAELAVQKKWFALKNLIRREVVPKKQFAAKFHEKTAAEWADFYKEDLIAKEIRYYAQPIHVRFKAAASQLLEASKKLRKLSDLEAETARLKKECAARDERISELSEAVEALTAWRQEHETLSPNDG